MLNIKFNSTWKNVAIAVSGGADSALLAYLICQKAQEHNVTVHIITNIRGWKTKPWQEHIANNVYIWLLKKFQNLRFVKHKNFVPPEFEWADKGPTITDEYGKLVSGDIIELRAYAEYICFHNKVDAYFNGVTRNPKDVDFAGMPTRDIDPTEENKHLAEMEHMGFMVYHPFRFTDKSEIVKMYKQLGIMELFEITRSCEGTIEGIDYITYQIEQYVPVCGECFWCKEREWALGQD